MPRDGAPHLRPVPRHDEDHHDDGLDPVPPPGYNPGDEGFRGEPVRDPHRKPYRALGHDRGTYFFLTDRGSQVLAFNGKDLDRTGVLNQLAGQDYWRAHYGKENGGVDTKSAANDLIDEGYGQGIYDPDRIRGRGAWIDGNRAILHAGDCLLVDRHKVGLDLEDSRFVYEASSPLITGIAEPLTTKQAHELVGICKAFRWECQISGLLLAGWIATAPICGGLRWRASIWVTGGTGTGKTYIQDNVIRPALGRILLQVQSKTSEAGIRQLLGSDARPVLFDEAEAEDHTAAQRMQGVLDLVRQASSEGGADIVKGSSDGRARRYRIRSCFGFSSINASVLHAADANRITILALLSPKGEPDEDAFRDLNAKIGSVITPEFSSGLLARSVRLMPVIRANAEKFARAVSVKLGSRRTGDQYGTLLAGAYSLHSEREITDAEAQEWVEKQDWTVVDDSEAEKDEVRLISHITQHRLRISSSLEPTIGSAIESALGLSTSLDRHLAENELRRTGIKVEGNTRNGEGIWVSNSHPALRTILTGTPWASGWARSLARLPGAKKSTNNESFAFGHVARAVWVPLDAVDPPDAKAAKGAGEATPLKEGRI